MGDEGPVLVVRPAERGIKMLTNESDSVSLRSASWSGTNLPVSATWLTVHKARSSANSPRCACSFLRCRADNGGRVSGRALSVPGQLDVGRHERA